MKTLIIHDYLDNIGGGEILMLSLAKGLGADFATMDLNRKVAHQIGFEDVDFKNLGGTLKTPPLKQIHASLKYMLEGFPEYDCYVFSGNWAHYAIGRHHPAVYYCHTPTRAFFDQYENMKARMGFLPRQAFKAWAAVHRKLDVRSVGLADRVVANSQNVKKRIKMYHGLEADVVNPGIDTGRYKWRPEEDYWISVNRLYPEKRVDMQVEAFRKLPDLKLKIVGGLLEGDHAGRYVRNLKNNLPDNVQMLGRLGVGELADLYSRSRGLVCTAVDEDFGMTPLEAMASGKPVVAVDEGGYRETMIDGGTGRLCRADVESVAKCVSEVDEEPGMYRDNCMKHAEKFDTKIFVKRMQRVIRQTVNDFNSI